MFLTHSVGYGTQRCWRWHRMLLLKTVGISLWHLFCQINAAFACVSLSSSRIGYVISMARLLYCITAKETHTRIDQASSFIHCAHAKHTVPWHARSGKNRSWLWRPLTLIMCTLGFLSFQRYFKVAGPARYIYPHLILGMRRRARQ